ncbi:MAG: transposase, partial [Actinobacteria bacterium]|nr:transposase [Actinomycetota bacterium]
LDQLDRSGHAVDTRDIERLSPLKFRNVNLHGRYSFALPEEVTRGNLRPLRDGREPDEDDVEP